jgi:hypothetical protein
MIIDIIVICIIIILISITIIVKVYCKDNQLNNNRIDDDDDCGCNAESIQDYIPDSMTNPTINDKPIVSDKDNKLEPFIVADAQDFHNYEQIKKSVMEEPDNFDKENMINPSDTDIVDYDKIIAYKSDDNKQIRLSYGDGNNGNGNGNNGNGNGNNGNGNGNPDTNFYAKRDQDIKKAICSDDFGWEAPNQYVSCANSSIASQYKKKEKRLLPFKIDCAKPNKLTAENYYKTVYNKFVIPIEDYNIRGYNYQEFGDYPTPYQVNGMRILSTNTKGLPPEALKSKNIPSGFNYAFHNTPAMPMP